MDLARQAYVRRMVWVDSVAGEVDVPLFCDTCREPLQVTDDFHATDQWGYEHASCAAMRAETSRRARRDTAARKRTLEPVIVEILARGEATSEEVADVVGMGVTRDQVKSRLTRMALEGKITRRREIRMRPVECTVWSIETEEDIA